MAVGPGGLDKDGKRVSCNVAVGDKVLIPQVSYSSPNRIMGAREKLRSVRPTASTTWIGERFEI